MDLIHPSDFSKGFIGWPSSWVTTLVHETASVSLRAAEARDARAALLLAKAYDPMVSRHLGSADQGPDLAQARSWYQKARERGAPEAQRQLDALASFPRR